MSRFDGRVALVTGAASGIGAAVAARLLDEGASVVAVDVDADGLHRRWSSDGGDRLAAVVADVTSEERVAEAVATAEDRFGGLDLAFNVAGGALVVDGGWEITNYPDLSRLMG